VQWIWFTFVFFRSSSTRLQLHIYSVKHIDSILQTSILVTLVTSEAVEGPATPGDNRPQGVEATSFWLAVFFESAIPWQLARAIAVRVIPLRRTSPGSLQRRSLRTPAGDLFLQSSG
jgi:hypothetical protein